MIRVLALAILLPSIGLWADEKQPAHPSYSYNVARSHELKPHRRTIPLEGVQRCFNSLLLRLTVSPTGDVLDAKAEGDQATLQFWPQVQGEVRQWKFAPFEENGKAVTAETVEYINFVPPERSPNTHVAAPVLRPDSKVAITLERGVCFLLSCREYTVAVTTSGIVFNGRSGVTAAGKHTDQIDPAEVRKLAARFVAADFYSQDSRCMAEVSDTPTYVVSISIDGHAKTVEDHFGGAEGIGELEHAVDALGRTDRWTEGKAGLVQALRAEKFNFHTFEAQVILKEAARRGAVSTMRDLLRAGVPLKPLPAPKPEEPDTAVPLADVGWLNAASRYPAALQMLIDAGASKDDQSDKDWALARAAGWGELGAVRTLIAYGANPKADLKLIAPGGTAVAIETALIDAAAWGDPDVVREILPYHPPLEARYLEGRTAMFFAAQHREGDKEGARVECVRLLAEAGANVNARDEYGDTPLHGAWPANVVEELLKLGADVNARNNDGETPIFTNNDDDAILLFIKHGADLTIRNNKGETVMEATGFRARERREAIRKALQQSNQH